MIRVLRGVEPPELAAERAVRLPAMRALVASRPPRADDFDGYRVAKAELAAAMLSKCWYCERRPEGKYEPVEHYRPKTLARRGEGFATDGYWWLAWTWANLFFICDDCNRAKGTAFPLAAGCVALLAEEAPPQWEQALLIDPSAEGVDPVDHIEFFDAGEGRWRARARNGSPLGEVTVRTLGLDGVTRRPSLGQIFGAHVTDIVRPRVNDLRAAIATRERRAICDRWDTLCRKLLRKTSPYAALSYDAVGSLVPAPKRDPWGLVLPRPPWDPATTPIVRAAR